MILPNLKTYHELLKPTLKMPRGLSQSKEEEAPSTIRMAGKEAKVQHNLAAEALFKEGLVAQLIQTQIL